MVSLDFAPAAGLCPDCGHGWAWYDYDEGQERCRHRIADGECGCRTDFIDATERPGPGWVKTSRRTLANGDVLTHWEKVRS